MIVSDFIKYLKTLPQDHELFADFQDSDSPEEWVSIEDALNGIKIVSIDQRSLKPEEKSAPRNWVVLDLY